MKKLLITIFVLLMMPLSSPAEDRNDLIRLKNDRLTVNVKDAAFEKVLKEIGEQARIKIVCDGTIDRTLSENFSDLPLEKGLKRLTRDLNCVFIYEPKASDDGEDKIIEIVIIPDSSPGQVGPSKPAGTAHKRAPRKKRPSIDRRPTTKRDQTPKIRRPSSTTLPEMKNDEKALKYLTENIFKNEDESVKKKAKETFKSYKDASVKLKFVKTLARIGGEKAMPPLMEALKDEDEEVREAAASALQKLMKSPRSR